MDSSIEDIMKENGMKREKGILFNKDKMTCNFFPLVTGCYPWHMP